VPGTVRPDEAGGKGLESVLPTHCHRTVLPLLVKRRMMPSAMLNFTSLPWMTFARTRNVEIEP
jgi:hypothetical protein